MLFWKTSCADVNVAGLKTGSSITTWWSLNLFSNKDKDKKKVNVERKWNDAREKIEDKVGWGVLNERKNKWRRLAIKTYIYFILYESFFPVQPREKGDWLTDGQTLVSLAA